MSLQILSLQRLLLFRMVGGRFAETTMCRAEIIQANFFDCFYLSEVSFSKAILLLRLNTIKRNFGKVWPDIV